MPAPAPKITSITPNAWNSNVATPINIAGVGMYPVKGVQVWWPNGAGKADCSNVVSYGTGDRITCLVPPMPSSITAGGNATITITLAGGGNMLTGAQCSLENNNAAAAGWTPGNNTFIATGQGVNPPTPDGIAFLSIQALAAGDTLAIVTGIPVAQYNNYYVSCSFRAAGATRNVYVYIYWMDSTGAYITASVVGPITDPLNRWATITNANVFAPAGATTAWFMPYIVGTAGGYESHYVDLMVMVGVNDLAISNSSTIAPTYITYVPAGGPWTGPGPCVRKAWLTLGSTTMQLEDPTQGYFCTQLDLGFPSVREVTNNKPDQDGTDDRTRFMGSRVISADITTLVGAGAQIDNIAGLFAPFMVPSVRPTLHYVLDRPGAAERTLGPLRAANFSAPIAGPFQRDIQLQWISADPVAHDSLVHSTTASAGSSTPPGRQYNFVPNRIYPPGASSPTYGQIRPSGQVAVRPIYRIYGPITGPYIRVSVFSDASTYVGDYFIQFLQTFTIGSGQWVDIDSAAKTAVQNDGTPVQSQINWSGTTWTSVGPNPGWAQLGLVGSSKSGSTQVVATWQEGYLS